MIKISGLTAFVTRHRTVGNQGITITYDERTSLEQYLTFFRDETIRMNRCENAVVQFIELWHFEADQTTPIKDEDGNDVKEIIYKVQATNTDND